MAARRASERGSVMRVDNSIDWERRLSYAEKQSGWEVFKYLYWGIYIFAVGSMLITLATAVGLVVFCGWAALLLAMFLIIYGFVLSLHNRLMKKHG